MSFRNPFITSFIYDKEEAAKVREALEKSHFNMIPHAFGEHVLSGIFKAGRAGEMFDEMFERLSVTLADARVIEPFELAIAGEDEQDRLFLHWDGLELTRFRISTGRTS